MSFMLRHRGIEGGVVMAREVRFEINIGGDRFDLMLGLFEGKELVFQCKNISVTVVADNIRKLGDDCWALSGSLKHLSGDLPDGGPAPDNFEGVTFAANYVSRSYSRHAGWMTITFV